MDRHLVEKKGRAKGCLVVVGIVVALLVVLVVFVVSKKDALLHYIRHGPQEIALKPHEVAATKVGDEIFDLSLVGNHLFLAANKKGLVVVQAPARDKLDVIGELDTPGQALDLVVHEGMVFLADGLSGLQIIDVSNPRQPKHLGSLDTPGKALAVSYSGNRVYLADESSLQIIDVSSPSSPQRAGELERLAADVQVQGDRLYLADRQNGLHIYSLSNKNRPVAMGQYPLAQGATKLRVFGDQAFVASREKLSIMAITSPARPSLLAEIPPPYSWTREHG